MNAEQTWDTAIAEIDRLSAVAQLRDLLSEARTIDKRVCGNCIFWMMSSRCPRERNVGGRKVGPHTNELACDEFGLKQWVSDLKQERLKKAAEFAVSSGLLAAPARAPEGGESE